MMTMIQRLLRDDSGAAMVETAFALPVLLTMIWGIFQFGVAMHAHAGMQNALGEGARLATLCRNPTVATGCSRPSNDEIIARMSNTRFGTGYGTFGTPTVTAGTAPSASQPADHIILGVTFNMPMNFLFFPGPTVTFTQTKRVYVAGTA
jgi:Flp pilus assembly protein TadG